MISKRNLLTAILLVCLSLLVAQSSPKKAFFKSLLIPGWGEISNNSKTGYIFLATEIALLSSNFYYANETDILQEKAFKYAVKYAGVNPGNYDDSYWVNLTRYQSSGLEAGGYNSYIYEQAINLYPNDVEMQQDYYQNNKIADDKAWHWEAKTNRASFSHIRLDKSQAEDIAKTLVGILTLNHVVSALNAARVAANYNDLQLNMSLNRDMKPQLNCSYKF